MSKRCLATGCTDSTQPGANVKRKSFLPGCRFGNLPAYYCLFQEEPPTSGGGKISDRKKTKLSERQEPSLTIRSVVGTQPVTNG